MSVSVTFWGNLADAAYQLRETRFAESLLDGVVRSVAHSDRAADSFCAHIGGQVAAVAILSRDHHQVVLADRRRLDCDHDLARRRQCDDARRCGGIEERLESFQPRPLFHSVMVEEVATSWRVLGGCNHNGPPESLNRAGFPGEDDLGLDPRFAQGTLAVDSPSFTLATRSRRAELR